MKLDTHGNVFGQPTSLKLVGVRSENGHPGHGTNGLGPDPGRIGAISRLPGNWSVGSPEMDTAVTRFDGCSMRLARGVTTVVTPTTKLDGGHDEFGWWFSTENTPPERVTPQLPTVVRPPLHCIAASAKDAVPARPVERRQKLTARPNP